MIETYKYRSQLKRLSNAKAKVKRLYAKDIKKALKEGKPQRKIAGLWDKERFEVEQIEEEMRIFVTDYLCNTAKKLFVPVPPLNDEEMWVRYNEYSEYTLTPKGISELKLAIRKEEQEIRKERREQLESWTRWIAIITGLVGAITGLVTILKN